VTRGPKPQEVQGVYWREDREVWAARYRNKGQLVRKVLDPTPSVVRTLSRGWRLLGL
jgi:hypothetical protein